MKFYYENYPCRVGKSHGLCSFLSCRKLRCFADWARRSCSIILLRRLISLSLVTGPIFTFLKALYLRLWYLIAPSSNDNMIAAVGQEMGVKELVVRRNRIFKFISRKEYSVFSSSLASEAIANIIDFPTLLFVERFAGGRVSLHGICQVHQRSLPAPFRLQKIL